MTPEEYYYRNIPIHNKSAIYDMRIKSLKWMLGCFKSGTIRKRTIIALIPITQLYDLLEYLEELERYEECSIVKEIIDLIYNSNIKTTMKDFYTNNPRNLHERVSDKNLLKTTKN